MTRKTRAGGKAMAVVLAVGVALLAAGTASARTTVNGKISSTCWQQIVNDWLDHNGNIQNTYPIPCYRQAIDHLNAYSDIQGYSNIIDDIKRAQLAALHHKSNGTTPPGGSSSSGPGGTSTPPSGGSGPGGSGSHSSGWFNGIADALSPGNARSIPLPLYVLAALALLLLFGAAGTWFAKRIQARRVAPVPAPSSVRRET